MRPMAKVQSITRQIATKRLHIGRLAQERGFRNVRVFGSVARGDAGHSSDVDFLVDAVRGTSLLDLIRFRRDMEKLLGRKVDIVTAEGLDPEMRGRVSSEAVSLEVIGLRAARSKKLKLGSRIAALFSKVGLTADIRKFRGETPRPADFGSRSPRAKTSQRRDPRSG